MATAKREGSIEVIALQKGFYGGNRVKVGDVFFVPSAEKSTWFVPTNTIEAEKAKGLTHNQKNVLINRPVTLGEIGQVENKSFNEIMQKQTKDESVKGKTPEAEAKDRAKADKEAADKKAKDLAAKDAADLA